MFIRNGSFFIEKNSGAQRKTGCTGSCTTVLFLNATKNKTEDKILKEILTDSVQNRFTAYLVAAVTNKRIRYMEKKKKNQEIIQTDLLENSYLDFEFQYHEYIGEKMEFIHQDWEKFDELLTLLENEKLWKALEQLKERERRILFARVFAEFTFEELGERFDMKPKQAEMAYYYVIRKLRKELEGNKKDGSKDEF